MYEPRTFEHDGKEYEIRVSSEGHTIHVCALLNGNPANGYRYSVELLTQVDAKMSGASIDPVEELINTATSDVKNGIWEEYVAAVAAAGNRGT